MGRLWLGSVCIGGWSACFWCLSLNLHYAAIHDITLCYVTLHYGRDSPTCYIIVFYITVSFAWIYYATLQFVSEACLHYSPVWSTLLHYNLFCLITLCYILICIMCVFALFCYPLHYSSVWSTLLHFLSITSCYITVLHQRRVCGVCLSITLFFSLI